ncbi:hypothetical protein DL769_007566 [Monosporascus sp. CRB-8-3]|nr:hypothetical protein DL769_007566 [Monosporascus sp. CRB-8-3]
MKSYSYHIDVSPVYLSDNASGTARLGDAAPALSGHCGENNQRLPGERINLDARNRLNPRDQSTYLVAETNKMGNRFIHYRQEDALAMMDNRVDLVRVAVESHAVNTLGVCRRANLVHKEAYKKMMKKMDKIDGSNNDIMAQVQLLREDGEQQRNEHQRKLEMDIQLLREDGEQQRNEQQRKLDMAERRTGGPDFAALSRIVRFYELCVAVAQLQLPILPN